MNQHKIRKTLGKKLQKLSENHRTHLVFSSNTDVGKTCVAAGLIRASLLESCNTSEENESISSTTRYCKVLQSGNVHDEEFIRQNCFTLIQNHKNLFHNSSSSSSTATKLLDIKTFYSWDQAQSPHWCSRIENKPVFEDEVLENLHDYLNYSNFDSIEKSTTLIETAGGVLSPGPASPKHNKPRHSCSSAASNWGWSTQADLYSSLGLPVILIGDGKLGGISATISSLESLIMRGYDVDMIALIHHSSDSSEYNNIEALQEYLSERLFKLRSGSGKALLTEGEKDIVSIPCLPPLSQPLSGENWYMREEVLESFHDMHTRLNKKWQANIQYKQDLIENGEENIWWPFTQHGLHDKSQQLLVDRASGDYYSVLSSGIITNKSKSKQKTVELHESTLFDAPASWWTQGLGHGEPSSALAVAAASARYSHVIFPSLLNEPAITLSKLLVSSKAGPGYKWASKAFFSDDGSTAVEVAIKMAMRLYLKRHATHLTSSNLTCIGLEDCYHGDTLGAMNIAVPSVFNETQQPWFQSKGLFLDPPTVAFQQGKLFLSASSTQLIQGFERSCHAINDVYDIATRMETQQQLYQRYRNSISQAWDKYEHSTESTIACTIIEPLIQGAGGMKFIDPLYQRALLDVSLKRRIPIIYDEIFSGLYRLGPNVLSTNTVLGVNPDIACYSKLLTGGSVPLGMTLANQEVFDSFLGDDKSTALLHGHSYTAYPAGCVASIHAMESFYHYFQQNSTRTYFKEEDVWFLSTLSLVKESFSLGTVLVVKLHPRAGSKGGYNAPSQAGDVVKLLKEKGNVYARVLGNVVYIMTSPFTEQKECDKLIQVLGECIKEVMHEDSSDEEENEEMYQRQSM